MAARAIAQPMTVSTSGLPAQLVTSPVGAPVMRIDPIVVRPPPTIGYGLSPMPEKRMTTPSEKSRRSGTTATRRQARRRRRACSRRARLRGPCRLASREQHDARGEEDPERVTATLALKRNMRMASGIARRTPSRACSSKPEGLPHRPHRHRDTCCPDVVRLGSPAARPPRTSPQTMYRTRPHPGGAPVDANSFRHRDSAASPGDAVVPGCSCSTAVILRPTRSISRCGTSAHLLQTGASRGLDRPFPGLSRSR